MEKRKRGRPRKNIKPLISEEEEKLAVIETSSSPVSRPPEFFKLFLSDRSSQQLKLPKHFTREFGESIKARSRIKDELCGEVWDVCVEKSEDDGVYYLSGKGWKDFINYHSLENGYFLIFRYEGNSSSFTVKVFTTNACKKSLPMDMYYKLKEEII